MKRKKATIIIILITFTLATILTYAKGDLTKISDIELLGQKLGFITLIPTVLVVLLAFVTNNILFSLSVGFVCGVLISSIVSSTSLISIPVTFVNEAWINISKVIFDIDNIKIVLLCLFVGGMVGIVRYSGGFEALALKLTKRIDTPREANLLASVLGCLIFFDDYANALIVGPIMKPICDRVKVSREKLSFIVDSTSAQIAGIIFMSSWVGVEILSIEKGLNTVGSNLNSFSLFLKSIPFSFYCIFSITFIFVNALIDKDFGPMLKAEKRARKGEIVSKQSSDVQEEFNTIKDKVNERIFVAIGCIITLIIFTIVSFYLSGRKMAIASGVLTSDSAFNLENIMSAISYANTTDLVSIAAIVGSIFTLIFGLIFKLFNLKDAIISWLKGAKELVSTVVMLLSAWCLSEVISSIGMTYFAVEIISMNVSWILVPVLIFVTCCIISLTSGSFGCLFVVMPLAVPLAFKVSSMGISVSDEIYLLICIGSVIAGSIFGDHCSPVTDCTILSAIGSGCSTMEHCISQLPYAIMNLFISISFGIVLTTVGVNVLVSILLGILVQIILLVLIGKKPMERIKNV